MTSPLQKAGVGFKSLRETAVDTTTAQAGGRRHQQLNATSNGPT
jgi:hypothetical protein